MRAVLVVAALLVTACGPAPRPRWACELAPRLFPSVNGPIPVCPWIAEEAECTSFEDYDGDGRVGLEDLAAYCRTQHDGDSLTLDVVAPYSRSGCYTCD